MNKIYLLFCLKKNGNCIPNPGKCAYNTSKSYGVCVNRTGNEVTHC